MSDNSFDREYNLIIRKIFNYLSYGNKSVSQIKDRLMQYIKESTLSEDTFESVSSKILTRLKELNYLDDKKTLDNIFLNHKSSSKVLSKLKIKTKLLKKGFSIYDIQPHLDNLSQDYEKISLKRDIEKKSRSKITRDKLIKHLLRKGHKYNLIINELDNA